MTKRKISPRDLMAYLAHELMPADTAAVKAHLSTSWEARRQLRDLRDIGRRLAAPIHDLEGLDLAARVRRETQRLDLARTPPRRQWSVSAFWLCAASLALAVGLGHQLESAGEFRSKSSALAEDASSSSAWAGVHPYVVRGGAAPVPLGDELTRGNGLLFSYTNLGEAPYEYLLVFAVGADGEVFWFHPDADDLSPATSLAIEGAAAQVPLPEVIVHDLQPGLLRLYALFSHAPLSTSDVEAWAAKSSQADLETPNEQAALQMFHVEVLP